MKIFVTSDLFQKKAQEDFPGGEVKIDHVRRMQVAPRGIRRRRFSMVLRKKGRKKRRIRRRAGAI